MLEHLKVESLTFDVVEVSQDPYEAIDRYFEQCSGLPARLQVYNENPYETKFIPHDKYLESRLPNDLSSCHIRLVPVEAKTLSELERWTNTLLMLMLAWIVELRDIKVRMAKLLTKAK